MRTTISTCLAALLLALTPAAPLAAQTPPAGDVWRGFASKLEVGTELNVRLRNGQRFRATLVDARDAALLLQPRTRVPVAVQPVPYDEILSLERRREGGGVGAGKAAAIGIASGGATFLAILLILLATVSD